MELIKWNFPLPVFYHLSYYWVTSRPILIMYILLFNDAVLTTCLLSIKRGEKLIIKWKLTICVWQKAVYMPITLLNEDF